MCAAERKASAIIVNTGLNPPLVTWSEPSIMTLHVAYKWVQQDKSGTFLYAAKDCIARRARHTRPAIEARNNQHLEWRRPGQVLFDVAIDSLEVVAITAILMAVV